VRADDYERVIAALDARLSAAQAEIARLRAALDRTGTVVENMERRVDLLTRIPD